MKMSKKSSKKNTVRITEDEYKCFITTKAYIDVVARLINDGEVSCFTSDEIRRFLNIEEKKRKECCSCKE